LFLSKKITHAKTQRRKESTIGATNIVIKNLLFASILIPVAFASARLPAESEVKPVKVLEVPGYTEGVVLDRDGAIYISDVYNGNIYRIGSDGEARVWAHTGAPNGHKILPDSTHLVCDGNRQRG
jgi:gluconolactonase